MNQNVSEAPQFNFLSNHAHVLVCLHRTPDIRMKDIAQLVGITERGVQRILGELEQANIIVRRRTGRRNHYEIVYQAGLRHPLEERTTIQELLVTLERGSSD